MARDRNPAVKALAEQLAQAQSRAAPESAEAVALELIRRALAPTIGAEEKRGPGAPGGPRDNYAKWVVDAKPLDQYVDMNDRHQVTLGGGARRYGRKVSMETAILLTGTLSNPTVRSVTVVTMLDGQTESAEDPGSAGNGEPGDGGQPPA